MFTWIGSCGDNRMSEMVTIVRTIKKSTHMALVSNAEVD